MKIKFRQKIYLWVLFIFLLFFNTVIFTLRAVQNSKNLARQKESLLAQQEYIIQQVADDMSAVYQSRPLGIPYIISRYGSRHAARGILMWVANGDSVVYSSVENPADKTLFTDFSEKRVSFVTDINGKKYFRVKSTLTGDFRRYKTVIAFPLYEFYKEWNDTVTVIMAVCRGVSLIVAAVLYLLLNRITKPIEELNRATIQFGKGNLQARVEHITDDEVGQTAENFNIMAGKICSQMETLENAAKEKQNFIDNFSHEMRTPLTAISGYAQYMLSAPVTHEEYYSTLSIISGQAKRLLNLADSMLNLTLMQNNKIEFEKINLKNLLENIPFPKMENISFDIKCPGDIFIFGNETLIESLVINLVNNRFNACKADDKENHRVTVEGKSINGYVILSVEDNGVGMNRETLANVSRPFYRRDIARSRKNGGAGLGGSIIQKIVDLHRAKLQYFSEPGQGTKARITFTTLK